MDFSLSEEQQMLSDGAEKFLAAHYSFEQRRALLSSKAGFSEQNWQTFAELGWLALPVPEDAGCRPCGGAVSRPSGSCGPGLFSGWQSPGNMFARSCIYMSSVSRLESETPYTAVCTPREEQLLLSARS